MVTEDAAKDDAVGVWSEDPLERFRAGYAPGLLKAGALATPVVTMAGLGLNRWLLGAWWRGDEASLWALGILAVLAVLMPFETARRLGRSSNIPRFYTVQSSVQILWLALLIWGSHAAVGLVGVMLLLSAVVNDTRYFYDRTMLLAQYALALPLLGLLLLVVDLLGGEGLLATHRTDAARLERFVAAGAGVSAVCLFVIKVVGGQWRSLDAQGRSTAALIRELHIHRAEQDAVQQASTLMEFGLSAGRFSHDVSSPLSTLSLSLAQLKAVGAEVPDVASLVRRMEDAVEALKAHREVLVSALRRRPELTVRPAKEVVEEAVRFARRTGAQLAGHEDFAVTANIEEADLKVAEQHIGAIADLISNAVRQSPERVELHGARVEAGLYRIAVRDFGLEAAEQADAVATVTAALRADAPPRAAGSQGLGIGVPIARLTALRFGGRLDVAAAPERGLVVSITIPSSNATDSA